MPPLEAITLFPNPNTPDLGCFLRRKHGVEVQPFDHNIHVELNPSVDFGPSHHQLYFRVVCGEAGFFQRGLVYLRPDLSIPPPVLTNFPPDFVLGGDYHPRPSDWVRFPTQSGGRFYFFFGQHRDPAGGAWTADAVVGHSYDIFENGTLSTIHFDDTGQDRDLDDLVLEAAVVGRRSWLDLTQAVGQAEVNAAVAEKGLGDARARFRPDEPVR